jgi:hypothetical protein
MEERRKTQRSRCLLGARVVFNARSSTMSCTVKNHSDEGAQLLFGETPYIPNQIEIMLDNRRMLVPAAVVWRSGCRVGIAFPRGSFLAEATTDRLVGDRIVASRGAGDALH